VGTLVAVFAEVRRVLAADGTAWLNLGDSYAGHNLPGWRPGNETKNHGASNKNGVGYVAGAKPKDLIGIPWRVAFALQADGWYLRSDIIWSKPNPMPESVTDRPTKAHEYLFLLSKSERYQYDSAAITERGAGRELFGNSRSKGYCEQRQDNERRDMTITETRNKRSVWTIPTMPYAGAHFATMPEALILPCILAGSKPGDLVLDPFVGSGTVGAVAERLGRRWVGTDLTYQHLAKKRTQQRGLREIPV